MPLVMPNLVSVARGLDVRQDMVSMTVVECVSIGPGSGELKVTTNAEGDHSPLRDLVYLAYDWVIKHLASIKKVMRSEPVVDLEDASRNVHVNILMSGSAELWSDLAQSSVAAALVSLLYQRPVVPGLLVVGEITISDRLLPCKVDAKSALKVLNDNGFHRVVAHPVIIQALKDAAEGIGCSHLRLYGAIGALSMVEALPYLFGLK